MFDDQFFLFPQVKGPQITKVELRDKKNLTKIIFTTDQSQVLPKVSF
jgi:hypothetical protein